MFISFFPQTYRLQPLITVFPVTIRSICQALSITSQNGLLSLDSQCTEPLLPARWGLVAGTLSLKGQLRLNGRSVFLKEMRCLFSGKFTIKKGHVLSLISTCAFPPKDTCFQKKHTSFFPTKWIQKKKDIRFCFRTDERSLQKRMSLSIKRKNRFQSPITLPLPDDAGGTDCRQPAIPCS